MNTYAKYCPNVFVAKCTERHEKGDVITVTTKYGKENEHYVHNLVAERDGFFYYSITRVDGYNMQERAKAKAERLRDAAGRAQRRAEGFYERSQKDADYLSLGEPIKVGHHSERRHRKAIDDAWKNTGRMVREMDKADELRERAEGWESHTEDINLSMPESLDYYRKVVEQAKARHQGLKDGTIEREHAYSLTYAKKAVNEAEKNLQRAIRLWG